jgi:hypothetical protein
MTISSPDQIANTINKSISNSIINSIQTVQNQAVAIQNVEINCSDEAVLFMTDQITRCIEELKAKNISFATIKKVCKPFIDCNAYNISIKSSLNITNLDQQKATIQQNVDNSLINNIQQDLKSQNSAFSFSSKDIQQNLNNISTIINDNIDNIVQNLSTSVQQEQNLILSNYEANNISINNASNIIQNSIQNIDGFSSIINNISNDLSQTLANKDTSLSDWVKYIVILFFIVIFILFLIIFLLKRKNTREFLKLILPYFIFIVGVFVIIEFHLIVKPSYILYKTNTKEKSINNKLLIFWCIIYSIIFGALEIIYYKFIKK